MKLLNFLLALLLLAVAGNAAEPQRPNILFLLSDDHSYPFLSCYGDPNVKTPALDQLAGGGHSVALKRDGMIVTWGTNSDGQLDIPVGLTDVTAIAAGANHTVALKSDGTVVSWGWNEFGQTNVPTGLAGVTAVAAGYFHTAVLLTNGTVVTWGYEQYNWHTVPVGLTGVVALAAGGIQTVALRNDGSVVAWGSGDVTNVPPGLKATAIAAGDQCTMAIGVIGPAITVQPQDKDLYELGGTASFSVTAVGDALSYQWRHDQTNLVGETNALLNLTNVQTNQGGNYTIVISNSCGSVTSRVAVLTVNKPGMVVAWGGNRVGQTNVPSGLSDVAAVTGGGDHSLALKSDGTIRGWGYDYYGQASVPEDLNVATAVAAGGAHTLALKADGTVVAWGLNRHGQSNVPLGLDSVIAIAGGGGHSVALKSDGTVIAWGYNDSGQTNVPSDLAGVTAIAAGGSHNLALKSDGTVVTWGFNANPSTVPENLSGVVAIAGGDEHSVALKSDGTVVAWGANYFGQTNVPAGLSGVTAISANGAFTVALKSNGTVVAWGGNFEGQTNVPSGLRNVTSIAAGFLHTLAIVNGGGGGPGFTSQPKSRTMTAGQNAAFVIAATGSAPFTYQWRRDGTNLAGQTGTALVLTNLTRADSGNYSVIVSNAVGRASSSNAMLRVLVPQRLQRPQSLADGKVRLRFGDHDGAPLSLSDAANFEVQATTNLVSTNWLRYTNGFSLTNGLIFFDDTNAANFPTRFYRVMEK